MNFLKNNVKETIELNEYILHERTNSSVPNDCDTRVEEYFTKIYNFRYEENWSLPAPEVFYTEKKWHLSKFQQMKVELNKVKNQLSQFDLTEWSQHTKLRDRAGFIFRELRKHVSPELLTQAWCKFYECLCQFPVVCEAAVNEKHLNSLHLCEAPGAFICALNHFLVLNHPDLKWNWIANSLNPEYEGNDLSHMIPDKRLINYTRPHWHFGLDKTGNIMEYYNYENILECAQRLGSVLLVTADGSVDCMSNPGEQESLVEHLHFCEVMLALSALAPGGTFIFKIFTMFESSTISLLFLVNNCFKSVHVYKPCTSKSGNSEVYIICLNYKGKQMFLPILTKLLIFFKNPNPNVCMLPLEAIPESFISQIEECSNYFMIKQIKTINDNLDCYKKITSKKHRKNDNFKYMIANHFLLKYNLKPINESSKLSVQEVKNVEINFNFDSDIPNTSLFLFGQNNLDYKIEKLTIEVGKQITKVLYSEFCDVKLLKVFYNKYPVNIELDDSAFLNLLNDIHINTQECFKLHINYIKDTDVYCLKLFNDFYNAINNINPGDNIIITGGLFLARFETSLLFLIISAFSFVQYFLSGVIILQKCTVKINSVRNLFDILKNNLANIEKESNFTPSILNVLPSNLLWNEPFHKYINMYNNTLLELYMSQ